MTKKSIIVKTTSLQMLVDSKQMMEISEHRYK